MKYCPYCGAKVNNSFSYCPECGKSIDAIRYKVESSKNDVETNASSVSGGIKKQARFIKWLCIVIIFLISVCVVSFATKFIYEIKCVNGLYECIQERNDSELKALLEKMGDYHTWTKVQQDRYMKLHHNSSTYLEDDIYIAQRYTMDKIYGNIPIVEKDSTILKMIEDEKVAVLVKLLDKWDGYEMENPSLFGIANCLINGDYYGAYKIFINSGVDRKIDVKWVNFLRKAEGKTWYLDTGERLDFFAGVFTYYSYWQRDFEISNVYADGKGNLFITAKANRSKYGDSDRLSIIFPDYERGNIESVRAY